MTKWLPRRDDEAARRLWERYVRRLLELAGQDLDRAVKPRVDAEDVVQSAFRSFFRRQSDYTLGDRDELWSLLVTITLNKVRNANRDHRRQKRDVRRTLGDAPDPSRGGPFDLIRDEDPTPEEAAALVEELEHRINDLASTGDPDLLQIARMKFEGHSNHEIAVALGLSDRSIERKLGRIRKRWEGER